MCHMCECVYVCMCVCARACVCVCVTCVCVFANHTVQDGTQSRTDICSVCVCVCVGGGGVGISVQNLPTKQTFISISMILVTF